MPFNIGAAIVRCDDVISDELQQIAQNSSTLRNSISLLAKKNSFLISFNFVLRDFQSKLQNTDDFVSI